MSLTKENEFETRLRITNYYNKEEVLSKINSALEKTGLKDSYKITYETQKLMILNFQKNKEQANIALNRLKLLKIENKNYSTMNVSLGNFITNQPSSNLLLSSISNVSSTKNTFQNKTDRIKSDKNRFDTKLKTNKSNYTEVKNLSESRNISCSKSLALQHRKIESMFLNHGPYIDQYERFIINQKKNKLHWIDKKGFNQFASKATSNKINDTTTIKNYVAGTPAQFPLLHKFREVHKEKWVGKKNFY